MLELINVHTYYGESFVLQGVSLKVEKDTVAALLGRNGMGKTTTIRSIIGFTPPRRGVIRFKEKDITNLPSYQIAQMGIGLVPQGRHIFPMLSVEENLRLALIGLPSVDIKAETQMAYEMFPRLGERKKQKGKTLSGGELQMLAIARAIMGPTRLLLMDEPSEGLAPVVLTQIQKTVEELKARNMTILLAEQNLQFALGMGDYFYIIDNGAIVFAGDKSSLDANKEVQLRYLGVGV